MTQRLAFAAAFLVAGCTVDDRNVTVKKAHNSSVGDGGSDGGVPPDGAGGHSGSSRGGTAGVAGTPDFGGAGPVGGAGLFGGGGASGAGPSGDGGAAGSVDRAGSANAGGVNNGGVGNGAGGTRSAGGVGAGGTRPGTGGASGAGGVGGAAPKVPALTGSCPDLKTGMVTVLGQQVQLWVGAKQAGQHGSVMFYWHGTGSSSTEASQLGPALNEIQVGGGIVASFTTSLGTGTNTGNAVWYTDDFNMADVILACAVEQLDVDPHRVYAAGCSSGGLQAGTMLFSRSSYVAAVMTNSGGVVSAPALEDPTHVPSIITAHGMTGVDVVPVDFAQASKTECSAVQKAGGFAVDCDDGGGHCAAPAALIAAQWQFLKDHPFGVTPNPYAGGLPSNFPTYCVLY